MKPIWGMGLVVTGMLTASGPATASRAATGLVIRRTRIQAQDRIMDGVRSWRPTDRIAAPTPVQDLGLQTHRARLGCSFLRIH